MSGQRRVGRRDALLALGAAAVALAMYAAAPALVEGDSAAQVPRPDEAAWWAVLGLLLLGAALLLLARRHPRGVLVATAATVPAAALVGSGDATGVMAVSVIVAAFVAVLARPLGSLAPALAAAAALVAAGTARGAVDGSAGAAEAVALGVSQAIGTLGLTVLAAVVVASRREAARARTGQAEALRREQEALVQAAIARERTAMARELHDIAAHHLSGIAVMSAAIGRQIDTDPAAAKEGVHQVRAQSTAVLRDLRRLVGLLREQDADDPRPETLAGVADLVADAVRTGRPVELTVLSDRAVPGAGVGPLAQLAGYRAVQEALANAARHAPGAACTVTVDDRAADAVVITVRNGPPAPGPLPPDEPGTRRTGFGLVGMRERAELTGAQLDAGPTRDGGWQVTLGLPREQEAR